MELNEFQKRAAGAPLADSIKIEAGAGTGKTSVLVERYLKLVLEDGVPPERILALTFTRKAASEMRRRIFAAFEGRSDRELYRSLYRASITNFHSFCHQLLSEDPASFSVGAEPSVASEVELRRLTRNLYRDFEAGRIEGLSEGLPDEDLTPSRLRDFFDRCMATMDKCRGMGMRPENLTAAFEARDEERYVNYVQAVVSLWNAYEEKLRLRNSIDFTTLINAVVSSLEQDGALRERIASRFDCILVDEFQDTSGAQNELVRLLSNRDGGRVTVVGDDKQSIYRWRDARVENIREFGGEPVPLAVNYRSSQEILDLADAFIRKDPWYAERTERLVAHRGPGGRCITVFHPLPDAKESLEEEARAVAAWIQELAGGGENGGRGSIGGYGDAAVLLRTMKASSGLPQIEREFSRRGIPYALVGTPASLENGILLTLQHLLTLLLHPHEEESLLFLLESEPLSLDDAGLMALFAAARKAARDRAPEGPDGRAPLDRRNILSGEALSAPGDEGIRERCTALSQTLDALQDAAAALDFQSFVWEALEAACVFLRMYSQGAEYPAIESVLERVYAIVEELLSKCEAGVNAFIEHLEVLTDMEKRSAIGEPTLPDGRVAVMTIHQAKGLEFSAVAVPGLKAKTDRAPAFYVSKEKGLFLEGFEGRGFDAFEEAVRHAENMSQEERCLVYVAMTRARDHLFLSTPKAMKERRKSGRDFFSDIMESLAAGGIPYVEWRRAPDVEEPRTVREEKVRRAAGDGEETGEAELKRWRAGRTAVRETDLQEAEPLRAVRYADWRALRTFSECPLQYYFRFVRGLPGVPEGEREPPLEPSGVPGESRWERRAAIKGVSGVDDATYGSFVHFVLQRLSARRPDGAKSVADDGKPAAGDDRRIAETIEECAGLFGLSAASTRDALKRMPGLIRRALGASSGGDGPVDERMCEQPFSIRTGEFLFTGIIDRIDRSGGRYRIVDYKTGEAKDEHRFQVQYYAWALSAVLGAEVVEGSLVYIGKECRVVEVDTSAEQIARVEASVREFERAAVERRYDAAPGGVCPGCPYGPVCPRSPSVGIRT